jgi:glycosyltransferase involved in cell wall biosynthesis
MKKLRIAYLLDSGPHNWKSQEETHFQLCRGLVDRGAIPVLVYSGKVSKDVFSRMRTSGAEVVVEARLHGLRHYYGVLASVFKRFHTNLVHIRYFEYCSILPWLVRSQSVRRIIYTEAAGWMPSQRRRFSWARKLTQARTKVMCRPIKQFIAISHFIRDRLIGYGVNPQRIVVVYNGVDIDHFSPNQDERIAWRRSRGVAPNELIISAASRLDPLKDIPTIIQGFAELVRRGIPARLFIAGAGPEEAELKSLGQELGLNDRVHWLGHLKDTRPLFQASDIFTLATVGEAFGFVLAEAMGCAVACVGSRCGGIPEVVAEGCTGLLATPRDPHSFADAYERLAKDENLRRAMGEAGVERTRRLFSIAKSVEDTLAVYQEALE